MDDFETTQIERSSLKTENNLNKDANNSVSDLSTELENNLNEKRCSNNTPAAESQTATNRGVSVESEDGNSSPYSVSDNATNETEPNLHETITNKRLPYIESFSPEEDKTTSSKTNLSQKSEEREPVPLDFVIDDFDNALAFPKRTGLSDCNKDAKGKENFNSETKSEIERNTERFIDSEKGRPESGQFQQTSTQIKDWTNDENFLNVESVTRNLRTSEKPEAHIRLLNSDDTETGRSAKFQIKSSSKPQVQIYEKETLDEATSDAKDLTNDTNLEAILSKQPEEETNVKHTEIHDESFHISSKECLIDTPRQPSDLQHVYSEAASKDVLNNEGFKDTQSFVTTSIRGNLQKNTEHLENSKDSKCFNYTKIEQENDFQQNKFHDSSNAVDDKRDIKAEQPIKKYIEHLSNKDQSPIDVTNNAEEKSIIITEAQRSPELTPKCDKYYRFKSLEQEESVFSAERTDAISDVKSFINNKDTTNQETDIINNSLLNSENSSYMKRENDRHVEDEASEINTTTESTDVEFSRNVETDKTRGFDKSIPHSEAETEKQPKAFNNNETNKTTLKDESKTGNNKKIHTLSHEDEDSHLNTGKMTLLLSRENTFRSNVEHSEENVPLQTEREITPIGIRTPSPSRKIKELIREINAPAQLFTSVREDPLTPKETNDNESIHEWYSQNSEIKTTEVEPFVNDRDTPRTASFHTDSQQIEMTVADIHSVTSKVTRNITVNREAQFDHLEHIERINKYVEESERQKTTRKDLLESYDKASSNFENSREEFQKIFSKPTPTTTTYLTEAPLWLQSTDLEVKSIADESFHEGDNQCLTPTEKKTNQEKDVVSEDKGNTAIQRLLSNKSREASKISADKQTSLEETRKHIIDEETRNPLIDDETRKQVIAEEIRNQVIDTRENSKFKTEETQTYPDELQIIEEQAERLLSPRIHTETSQGQSTATHFRTESKTGQALTCSKCLNSDINFKSFGFCEDCLQYLCKGCLCLHAENPSTSEHNILSCYCKNELAIQKFVSATGYCRDCGVVFCSQCAIHHSKLRRYRRHRIIQSSFVSKPVTQKANKKRSLSSSAKTTYSEKEPAGTLSKDKSKYQVRSDKHKALVALSRDNPYRFAYSDVLPSLYPGPKKTLAETFTSRPKWPKSSFPLLPFLVEPKPINEQVEQSTSVVYQDPFEDRHAKKMKRLRCIYGIQEDIQSHQLKGGDSFHSRQTSHIPSIYRREQIVPVPEKRHVSSTTRSKVSIKKFSHVDNYCLALPFPSCEKRMVIKDMDILMNGKLLIVDSKNNEVKLYNKAFICIAALQFRNRLVNACSSNLCETDLYAATGFHIYEISTERGMELKRKFKIAVRKIEGLACWKYGLVVVWKRSDLTWELLLMDYRGNTKCKLEILNPLTGNTATSILCHLTMTRRGKYISITDTKSACIVTVDVITRKIIYEKMLPDKLEPSYMTADGENNIYVSCCNKVIQISKHGDVVGTIIEVPKDDITLKSIVYNKSKGRIYVQTSDDTIAVYKLSSLV